MLPSNKRARFVDTPAGCPSHSQPCRSYGTSGYNATAAYDARSGRGDERRTGASQFDESSWTRHEQTHTKQQDTSLLRRALGGIGVLAMFAFGVSWMGKGNFGVRGDMASPTEPGTVFQTVDTPIAHTRTSEKNALLATFRIVATNEYGEYDRSARVLYGLEMVIEPFKETKLTITGASSSPNQTHFCWKMTIEENGRNFEENSPLSEDVGGQEPAAADPGLASDTPLDVEDGAAEVHVTLTKPGRVYLLVVEERNLDGTVVAEASINVSCKYVRREMRDLTDRDLETFMDALEVYYTISNEEGKSKYGEGFFNYERLVAYHNVPRNHYCYHAGLQFLTAHVAFGNVMEQALHMIDPTVSLPFWDFMIEASTLGSKWSESAIFGEDMFGSAMGEAESSFKLMRGRFGGISTIFDSNGGLFDSRVAPNHNAYGVVAARFNFQDAELLTRASSFCNLKADATFATQDVFFACFDENDNLSDWESCLEKQVHGDMHGLLGGAFDCNVDMHDFHEKHPEYSPALLTFLLEYLTVNFWPSNSFMPESNVCDLDCVGGQARKCGCTCTLDALTISEDQVYTLTSDFLSGATSRFSGSRFITYDESRKYPYGLKQNGVELDHEATTLLLRYIIKIGCEPGATGMMAGGASPMDPIFWVLHPMFEKALHVLWMSPKFRDSYMFTWEDGTCNGSRLDDRLPFTERALGMGTGIDFLTNAQLLTAFHASNPRMPYVYEKFSAWGATDDWDFCPECTRNRPHP